MLLPKMHNYDGVRHFIEYAVPLGLLTGIGAAKTAVWVNKKMGEKMGTREKKGTRNKYMSPFFMSPFLVNSL